MGIFSPGANALDPRCPGADDPAPPILPADLSQMVSILEHLRDTEGRPVWKSSPETMEGLREIFNAQPPKTKLEQFFQLLYLLQEGLIDLPVEVRPPGITELLVAARVFTEEAFPRSITRVELVRDDPKRSPLYRVQFSREEVRFPINQGQGFSLWQQGMCQIVKELVFYPGFSFRLRTARNSKNLVVDDFKKAELYGKFGTRRIFSIDINYVDLEKVEFIRGTNEGKVKARVSQREFRENEHAFLFRFIGTLIPNTSQQRIDW